MLRPSRGPWTTNPIMAQHQWCWLWPMGVVVQPLQTHAPTTPFSWMTVTGKLSDGAERWRVLSSGESSGGGPPSSPLTQPTTLDRSLSSSASSSSMQ